VQERMGEGVNGGVSPASADPNVMRRELEEELRELESRLSRSTRSLEERLKNLSKMQDGIVVPPPLELVLPSASPINKFSANGSMAQASPQVSPIHRSSEREEGESAAELERFRVDGGEGTFHRSRSFEGAGEGSLPVPRAQVGDDEVGEECHDERQRREEYPMDDLSDFEDEEEEEEVDELAGDVRRPATKREKAESARGAARERAAEYPSHSLASVAPSAAETMEFGSESVDTLSHQSREEIEKRRKEKEIEYEQELRQLQEKLKRKAAEKVEVEEMRERHALELAHAHDEAREARTAANELQKEILQLQKRLNDEMTAANAKDEDLQRLQRKFPAMLRELDSLSSRNASLTQEKEDLLRQVNELRKELMQLKDEGHAWVFDLNTRLTETVLLVSELRGKEERSQDVIAKESSQVAELRKEVTRLEKERRKLKASLAAAAESGSSRGALAEEQERAMKRQVDQLKAALRSARESAEDEIAALRLELSQAQAIAARSQHEEEDLLTMEEQLQAERSRSLELQQLAQSYKRQLQEAREEHLRSKQRMEKAEREREHEYERERERARERQSVAEKASAAKRVAVSSPAVGTPTKRKTGDAKTPASPAVKRKTPQSATAAAKKTLQREPISRRTLVRRRATDEEEDFDNDASDEEVPLVEERELRGRLYTPRRGDEIDELLAVTIRSKMADGLELLPPNFARISRGIYQFGTKKITVKVHDRQPVIRVGGGFMTFTKFVKKFGRSECMRISKVNDELGQHADRTSPVHQALHRTARRSATASPK